MKLIFLSVFILFITIVPTVYAEGSIGPAERLQDIQQRRKSVVSVEQRPSAIARCSNGKRQIAIIQAASENAVKKRLAAYGSVQKEIKAIELRMSKQGADASEIDLLIGKLQQNLDVFSEQSRYSQQLAEDIGTIDCASTPELYLAAVEEYTETRNDIYTAATELKVSILESPQTTFKPLINRLKI